MIDGVYRPRNGVGFGDLGEIERIEVLKGPQGTVFGKNTSAGVDQRHHPAAELQHRASKASSPSATTTRSASPAALNDALGDNAAFRIYAAKRKRDGFIDVRTGAGPRTETEDDDQNFHTAARPAAAGADRQPRHQLHRRLHQPRGELLRRRDHRCAARTGADHQRAVAGRGRGAGRPIRSPASPTATAAPSRTSRTRASSAEVNWITPWFGGATLTSITAWRDWQLDQRPGLRLHQRRHPVPQCRRGRIVHRLRDLHPGIPPDRRHRQHRLDGRRCSIPTRTSTATRPIASATPTSPTCRSRCSAHDASPAAGPTAPSRAAVPVAGQRAAVRHRCSPASARDDVYKQNAKSAALFTNNTWHATDALDLTLGLRYTREDKELDSVYSNPNGSPGCGRPRCPRPGRAAWRVGRGASSCARRAGGGICRQVQHRRRSIGFMLPAVGQRPAQRSRHPSGARGEGMVRHAQGGLSLERARDDLRLGRARLQGRRLQPRSRAVHRRPVQRRRGHRRRSTTPRSRASSSTATSSAPRPPGPTATCCSTPRCSTRPTTTSSSTASSAPASWCARSPRWCRKGIDTEILWQATSRA